MSQVNFTYKESYSLNSLESGMTGWVIVQEAVESLPAPDLRFRIKKSAFEKAELDFLHFLGFSLQTEIPVRKLWYGQLHLSLEGNGRPVSNQSLNFAPMSFFQFLFLFFLSCTKFHKPSWFHEELLWDFSQIGRDETRPPAAGSSRPGGRGHQNIYFP